ncbi:hypothetical protein KVA01_04830 [Kocuria varians]|uniref:ANTAR domain-containing protein n=1 Tax=Kocuria varians TaxID=1272 RepID=A0A4Y4CZF4_KOCVA|nr:hypothetical protein KVA01_04830 [Kocuria varians]
MVPVSSHEPTPFDHEPTVSQLEDSALRTLAQLSGRGDPEAFQALLRISAAVGEHLGISARSVAEAASWSAVAGAAGTSRQAAWSRWKA